MEMLFSEDEDFEKFEGTDLAEVDACKLTVVKELDFRLPICSAPIAARRIWITAKFSNRRRSYIKKASGGKRQVFLTFVFSDVIVTGYTLDIGGDAIPEETVNLVFAKCRIEYKPQTAEGGLGKEIDGGWDMIERGKW